MQQQHLIPGWIPADGAMPDPGQKVFAYFASQDGAATGPIVTTPIHADGSHILNGRSIYRPILWWLPIPPVPTGDSA